jgi:hypothetical protein
MEMSVDDVTHRLVRDLFQLVEQDPGSRWRDVIVHNNHVVVVDDDRRIANDCKGAGPDSVVDSLFHLVEAERFSGMAGACRGLPGLRRDAPERREWSHGDSDENQARNQRQHNSHVSVLRMKLANRSRKCLA